jgi:hypothetical protein
MWKSMEQIKADLTEASVIYFDSLDAKDLYDFIKMRESLPETMVWKVHPKLVHKIRKIISASKRRQRKRQRRYLHQKSKQ